TVRKNIIPENSALWGGGIFCRGSRSLISDNIIIKNSAATNGGGLIITSPGRPTIQTNIISGNSAGNSGGGMKCSDNSNPVIDKNIIVGNSAVYRGGGIRFSASNALLVNNTISGNTTESGGAISCLNSSTVTVTNSILWANTAPNNGEIEIDPSSSLIVTYSDVQGGWAGEGNIDADPIFVGPYNQDFYLRWHSPCIDVGDPSLTDPDGTRSDMGALYFNQDVAGIIELYPRDTPIVIPPEGGDVVYDGWVFNFVGLPGRADIWTYALVPEIGRYGPITLYQNVRIPADSLGRSEITQHIPGDAPEGDYVFVAYVGEYRSSIIDSSCFYFSKSDSFTAAVGDCPVPVSGFTLSQNYPNPFNATTTIYYQVPAHSHVKLEVYNLLGQKVATLVDERQQAGYKSVNWDASEVSSGLYFYKLTAGDYIETRRMMLVK
ncbi:MAG: T9SS type A sorting domain-containing protein, partial [Candidatus Zixiibacteriota bacterium]